MGEFSEYAAAADSTEVRKSVPILRRILNWCKSDKYSPCSPCSRKLRECKRSLSKKHKDPMLTFAALCEPDPCKCYPPGCSECLPCFAKYKCIRDSLPAGLQLLDNRCDRLRAVKWLTYPADPCRLRSGQATDEGSGDTPTKSQLSPSPAATPRRPAAGRDDGRTTFHRVVEEEEDEDDDDYVDDDDDEEEEEEEDDDDDDESDYDEEEEGEEEEENERIEWNERRRLRHRNFSRPPSPPRQRFERLNLNPGPVGVVVCNHEASSSHEGSEMRPVPRTRTLNARYVMPTPPPRRHHSCSRMLIVCNERERGRTTPCRPDF